MQVQRTQGYNMQFGMNYEQAIKKSGVTVVTVAGKTSISGAISNRTNQKMGVITLFGEITPKRIYETLKQQAAKIPAATTGS